MSLRATSASPEEAAAIVAALERFKHATTAPSSPAPSEPEGWRQSALLEGISRAPSSDAANPWINT